jgi:hypothetical protein
MPMVGHSISVEIEAGPMRSRMMSHGPPIDDGDISEPDSESDDVPDGVYDPPY